MRGDKTRTGEEGEEREEGIVGKTGRERKRGRKGSLRRGRWVVGGQRGERITGGIAKCTYKTLLKLTGLTNGRMS